MMVKFWIWFWSFVSGMGLITSITTYKLGEPTLALTNFGLTLVTTLVALKYMENAPFQNSRGS
jgi:hypothetical protein